MIEKIERKEAVVILSLKSRVAVPFWFVFALFFSGMAVGSFMGYDINRHQRGMAVSN